MRFKLIPIIFAAVVIFALFSSGQKAQAYDMNLIMTDAQFTNYRTMSAGQINDFLVSKGSVYANYVIPEYMTVPYPYEGGNWGEVSVRQINGDTPFYGKTVAQLIYDESQSHNINPQVMLAIMQKESSTVEQSSVSSTRLAWPLFYGFNETMASFGYDQATSESRAQDFGGVGQQIAYATWNFRGGYYGYDNWLSGARGDWHAAMNIDGTTVYPQSIATRLLYTYTPHSWQTFLNVLSRWGWAGSYSAQFVSQSAYPTVGTGQSASLTISYLNSGSTSWDKGTVNLGLVDRYYNPQWGGYDMRCNWVSPNRLANLNQDSVAPGEIGSFTFTVCNSNAPIGNHRLDVGLVADGITWFNANTHAYWDVYAVNSFQAAFAGQSAYPTVANGQATTLNISYLNNGASAWQQGVVNLALVDRNYNALWGGYDMRCNWVSPNRLAYLNQASVAPGAVGTFTFTVCNSNAPVGNHRLDVGLVADGIKWFDASTHAYWDVWVNTPYQAAFVSQSSYPTVANGQITPLTISYRNTGSVTWQKGVVNLGLVDRNYNALWGGYDMRCNWVSPNRLAYLNEDTVAPGAVGTFTFTVANSDAPSGNHRLDVGLVADGVTWFSSNTHAYWDVWTP